jgi:hypothetical protein
LATSTAVAALELWPQVLHQLYNQHRDGPDTGIFAVAYDQYFHAQDFYQWWANSGSTTDR